LNTIVFANQDFISAFSQKIGNPAVVVSTIVNPNKKYEFLVLDRKLCKLGEYRKLNYGNFPPLDSEIIDEYLQTESIFLKMSDRLGPSLSYQKRKDLYLKHLRFWHGFLTSIDYDAIVFENIPHEGFDFIAYEISTKMSKKTFMFYQMPIRPKKTYLLQLITNLYDHGIKVDQIRSKKSHTNFENLNPKFRGYLEVIESHFTSLNSFTRSKKNKKALFSCSFCKRFKSIVELIKTVLESLRRLDKDDFIYLVKLRLGLGEKYLSKIQAKNFYQANVLNSADLSDKYIYFPLHYQPELSTSPLAKHYVDLSLVCELLANATKSSGVKIYIREHPRAFSSYGSRTKGFYQRMIEHQNVFFISGSINSFELIDKSFAVATINGSCGWEALLRKKNVLMFGPRFYSSMRGCYNVRTISDLREAIKSIGNTQDKISDNDIFCFLKSLESETIEGFNYLKDESIATVSKQKSTENKINILSSKINNLDE